MTQVAELAQKMLDEWTYDKYTKRFYARDAKSRYVTEYDPTAVRWCFVGMTNKLFSQGEGFSLRYCVENLLNEKADGPLRKFITDVNDGPRGHKVLCSILQQIAKS